MHTSVSEAFLDLFFCLFFGFFSLVVVFVFKTVSCVALVVLKLDL